MYKIPKKSYTPEFKQEAVRQVARMVKIFIVPSEDVLNMMRVRAGIRMR